MVFEKPEFEVIEFEKEEIICTSTTPCTWQCVSQTCNNVCREDGKCETHTPACLIL